MKKKFTLILVFILCLTSVSAMTINFYYSEGCPHCQSIKPLVEQLRDYLIEDTFVFLNTIEPFSLERMKQEKFMGVPAFHIKTDDGRDVKFVGADQIKLLCEVSEMSLPECETHPADYDPKGGSWFVD